MRGRCRLPHILIAAVVVPVIRLGCTSHIAASPEAIFLLQEIRKSIGGIGAFREQRVDTRIRTAGLGSL
jgi:hypothetical protein